MITYEAIRKAHAEEKAGNRLSRLPDGFFFEVAEYLEKKAKLSEKEEKWELDSAKNTLQDLTEIRERKVLNAALFSSRTGVAPENMLPVERDFFDKIVCTINDFRKARESMGQESALPVIEALQDIPEFVGADMKGYGPFSKGDVAPVPEENARLLVEAGSAAMKCAEKAAGGTNEGI